MSESALIKEPQSASSVLMVRPARFGFNAETAASNAFQERPGPDGQADLQALAVREFARPGDVVLIKASRAMRLERITEALQTKPEKGPVH